MTVAIIDYGMGNIMSVVSALKYVGVTDMKVTSEYEAIKAADKIILPGVGSFAKAMKEVRQRRLDIYLNETVLKNKKPIFGICLGMQLLGLSSTEEEDTSGLGFIQATVDKFSIDNLKVPHVGVNQVVVNSKSRLYKDFEEKADFYFTHSYRMTSGEDIQQSMCSYGESFIASFEQDNIAGAQFHPELSQQNGLKMIKNFIELF